MNSATEYILIALIAFAIIAIFTFWNRPFEKGQDYQLLLL